jgi:hypothetical protein
LIDEFLIVVPPIEITIFLYRFRNNHSHLFLQVNPMRISLGSDVGLPPRLKCIEEISAARTRGRDEGQPQPHTLHTVGVIVNPDQTALLNPIDPECQISVIRTCHTGGRPFHFEGMRCIADGYIRSTLPNSTVIQDPGAHLIDTRSVLELQPQDICIGGIGIALKDVLIISVSCHQRVGIKVESGVVVRFGIRRIILYIHRCRARNHALHPIAAHQRSRWADTQIACIRTG